MAATGVYLIDSCKESVRLAGRPGLGGGILGELRADSSALIDGGVAEPNCARLPADRGDDIG